MKETDTTNYTQSTSLFKKLQEEAEQATGRKDKPQHERGKGKNSRDQNANNYKL